MQINTSEFGMARREIKMNLFSSNAASEDVLDNKSPTESLFVDPDCKLDICV